MSNQTTTPSPLTMVALIVSSLVGIVVLKFGFIFILIAILPSIVAYFIDRDAYKSAFRVVLLCNLCAMIPYLMPMLSAAARMQPYDVMALMSDPIVWLVVYSGAAVGWSLIFLCSYIARFLVILYCEYQISRLDRFQKKLVIEWGERVKQEQEKSETLS
ncbi:MAG: hypothetical protein SFW63_00640 [Alphaproteobacteria bacterium]|nr:hypothetical protein [Alphaproteobacteria bacterium]